MAVYFLSPGRSRAVSVSCRRAPCNWQGEGSDWFAFSRLRDEMERHAACNIFQIISVKASVRNHKSIWLRSAWYLFTQLCEVAMLIVQFSGSVGIEPGWWWHLSFSSFSSLRQAHWVNYHFFRMEKTLFWLLFPKRTQKKFFPLVSILFRYSITHLLSDLQKALCSCNFII